MRYHLLIIIWLVELHNGNILLLPKLINERRHFFDLGLNSKPFGIHRLAHH